MATLQVDDSVRNCLITRQPVPLELLVGKFVAAEVEAELGMEESTVGESVLFLACPSMFILVIYHRFHPFIYHVSTKVSLIT